jgi:cysteine desulfurase/selenocysteine lyase
MTQAVPTSIDIESIRADFPILHQTINGKPLVYFDNAATTQKPKAVIKALIDYYEKYNANVHRGAHQLAAQATEAFESTRKTVQQFINAAFTEEIIFTSGTTEGINLVANTFGRSLQQDDEIIISGMEHHSNIVPWQMLCEQIGAKLKVIPVLPNGTLDLETYYQLLSERTRLVSIVYVSNALGTINPVQEIIKAAKKHQAAVLLDAAQAVCHMEIDVQKLDIDFLVFSGHKLLAPTGTGILYGKKELLEKMPPYRGGGEMIKEVTFEKTTYNELPYKFEAGTPNIADMIAFKAAIDYIQQIGRSQIAAYENELLQYATAQLQQIESLKIIGTASQKVSIISFVIHGIHSQDIGILLDNEGIATRTGHHCTQPLMKHFGLLGTTRASMSFYNTTEEIDRLVMGIKKVIKMLR